MKSNRAPSKRKAHLSDFHDKIPVKRFQEISVCINFIRIIGCPFVHLLCELLFRFDEIAFWRGVWVAPPF